MIPRLTAKHRIYLVVVLLAAIAAAASEVYRTQATQTSGPPSLAAWAPPGALLTIETPDFASLLQRWQTSLEERAWLTSDNYAVFSRSRLFARLQEAQAEFAGAAGVPVDANFLANIAGSESFFAWYDIGHLQVVYITRMTPEMQKRNSLLAQSGRFEQRQSGGITFYVHSGTAQQSDPSADDAEAGGNAQSGESRTVAFATTGDWLILATDEQLMARTLELIGAKENAESDSLASVPWYSALAAQAPAQRGELRMALDLSRIVRSPYFRSYWVQQNVTELSHYRAALCDLYNDGYGFREERILLPQAAADASGNPAERSANLDSLTAFVPQGTAVFRAVAYPSGDEALHALMSKLLHPTVTIQEQSAVAPIADLSTPQAGTEADLETRIDAPAPTPDYRDQRPRALQALLASMDITGMLTLEGNFSDSQSRDTPWVPFHSAVVLQATRPWDPVAVQAALSDAAKTGLTAGRLGVTWDSGHGTYRTGDAHRLVLHLDGNLCIVADDESLMNAILTQPRPPSAGPAEPSLLQGGFDHRAARLPFQRWTAIVDGVDQNLANRAGMPSFGQPSFFGKNVNSLSTSFEALEGEHISIRRRGDVTHQTVTYTFAR